MARTREKNAEPQSAIQVITADIFAGIPWLVHGFSTRHGGVSEVYGGGALNLGITREDTRDNVERNRELFFAAIGAADEKRTVASDGATATRVKDPRHTHSPHAWPAPSMRQIHSSVIHLVREIQRDTLQGDGLITDTAGIALSVRVADCMPILLVDPVRRAVGAVHAGWRGTLARIVVKAIGEFRRNFGSDPADLKAAIGPGIHRCCYEVGEEFREKFSSQFPYGNELFEEVFSSDPVRRKYPLLFMNMRAPGHGEPPRTLHLDLVEANRRQLQGAGLHAENIWASELCTSCRTDLLFSHRKEKGVTGRMAAAVGIRQIEY